MEWSHQFKIDANDVVGHNGSGSFKLCPICVVGYMVYRGSVIRTQISINNQFAFIHKCDICGNYQTYRTIYERAVNSN